MTQNESARQHHGGLPRARRRQGGDVSWSFGEYTAFPHGSIQPQQLKEGDVVLIDAACSVDGYQSDITRTVVFGKPTQAPADVWDLEKQAQAAAFAAAQVGAPCESVDAAARKVITDAGFGPGLQGARPAAPHGPRHRAGRPRVDELRARQQDAATAGHVLQRRADDRIYGEFGIRLEDCLYITRERSEVLHAAEPGDRSALCVIHARGASG